MSHACSRDGCVDARWFVKATAAVVTAAALMALAQPADAQMTRAAAVGLFRTATATFALDGNLDNVPELSFTYGAASDVPFLGDVTGSGQRGAIVYRSGTWLIDFNNDGVTDRTVTYGSPGDVPLVGDLDGDGKEDLVLWRNGQWLVNTRLDGTTQFTYQFGGSRGDVPLLGDMNGDGRADLVIFNRGSWYVSHTRANQIHATYALGSGATNEIPVILDFDGDGRDDVGTYVNGVWTARSTTGQMGSFTFGTATDKPLYFGRGAAPDLRLDTARLLQQSTFGATNADLVMAMQMTPAQWVDLQLSMPHVPLIAMGWFPQTRPQPPTGVTWPFCTYPYGNGARYDPATPCDCNAQAGTVNQCQRDVYTNFWVQNQFLARAVSAPDQLRHRVAWALSQILVTSNLQDPIAYPMRDYQQLLLDNAFGRYEDILYAITLSPWMGNYLDMVRNDGSPAAQARGVVPNENYARELFQLYSTGLWRLNNDGTLQLDAGGNLIPTYNQADIVDASRALTGWAYPPLPGQTPQFTRGVNYIGNMTAIEGPVNGTGATNYHDVGAKTVMGVSQPAGQRADADVRWVVGLAANHPTTGVYIGRQLIQQLVTSNPSPAYVSRITAVWNNNGAGVRGDLRAVVRAILLDPEARAPSNPVVSSFGKLKEPVLLTANLLRAFGGTTDGVFLRTPLTNMGQNVYNAPTVFNYYQQDYIIPGTNLSGPPFQILDATTVMSRTNSVWNLVFSATCDTGQPTSPSVCGPAPDPTVFGSIGTKFDWSSMKAFANDPTALVDVVGRKLLNGAMTRADRMRTINAVAAVPLSVPPTQTQLLDRVRTAVYLIAVSPSFQVEF
ncbi:MAG TPA: DUF1800 family protein [Casimicrobiaceae bacterium]|nr:DUF1800 family protein [Casimicrobiaceae bacterium]